MRRDEHERHKRKVARIQCLSERLLPSNSVPVRSLKVRLQSFSLQRLAFQARLGVVRTPRTNVVALTARALEWAIFPPQRMDIGLTRVGAEEVVEMRHHRHG